MANNDVTIRATTPFYNGTDLTFDAGFVPEITIGDLVSVVSCPPSFWLIFANPCRYGMMSMVMACLPPTKRRLPTLW